MQFAFGLHKRFLISLVNKKNLMMKILIIIAITVQFCNAATVMQMGQTADGKQQEEKQWQQEQQQQHPHVIIQQGHPPENGIITHVTVHRMPQRVVPTFNVDNDNQKQSQDEQVPHIGVHVTHPIEQHQKIPNVGVHVSHVNADMETPINQEQIPSMQLTHPHYSGHLQIISVPVLQTVGPNGQQQIVQQPQLQYVPHTATHVVQHVPHDQQQIVPKHAVVEDQQHHHHQQQQQQQQPTTPPHHHQQQQPTTPPHHHQQQQPTTPPHQNQQQHHHQDQQQSPPAHHQHQHQTQQYPNILGHIIVPLTVQHGTNAAHGVYAEAMGQYANAHMQAYPNSGHYIVSNAQSVQRSSEAGNEQQHMLPHIIQMPHISTQHVPQLVAAHVPQILHMAQHAAQKQNAQPPVTEAQHAATY